MEILALLNSHRVANPLKNKKVKFSDLFKQAKSRRNEISEKDVGEP